MKLQYRVANVNEHTQLFFRGSVPDGKTKRNYLIRCATLDIILAGRAAPGWKQLKAQFVGGPIKRHDPLRQDAFLSSYPRVRDGCGGNTAAAGIPSSIQKG